MLLLIHVAITAQAQQTNNKLVKPNKVTNNVAITDTAMLKSLDAMQEEPTSSAPKTGIHQSLKTKFIEGDAGFMSLVALALLPMEQCKPLI